MIAVFADTSYFLAMLSPSDMAHNAARHWGDQRNVIITTTDFVLLELANALAGSRHRQLCPRYFSDLRRDSNTTISPLNSAWFEAGMQLYERRPDKAWSLTDCVSFLVMQERQMTDALTTDRHFEQAGFRALLRDTQS